MQKVQFIIFILYKQYENEIEILLNKDKSQTEVITELKKLINKTQVN